MIRHCRRCNGGGRKGSTIGTCSRERRRIQRGYFSQEITSFPPLSLPQPSVRLSRRTRLHTARDRRNKSAGDRPIGSRRRVGTSVPRVWRVLSRFPKSQPTFARPRGCYLSPLSLELMLPDTCPVYPARGGRLYGAICVDLRVALGTRARAEETECPKVRRGTER